jgi:hypothetical protein
MWMRGFYLLLLFLVLASGGCGSDSGGQVADTLQDGGGGEVAADSVPSDAPSVPADAASSDAPSVPADGDAGRGEDGVFRTTPGGLPMELPFSLTRPPEGEPVPAAEISEFTRQITGFWAQADYFTWVYEISHGVDASTGFPDYLIWWHDVEAVKEGDTVTFRNSSKYGGSHNNAEPTNMVLIQATGGYLLSGDPAMRDIVVQFARSNTACMEGFVFDAEDGLHHLLARNIVTFNHDFVLPSGKKKAVDYTDWYSSYEGWNANRYHYPDNPTWGDLWVTTMRSKDDLPYIYRAAAWLPYVIELTDDDVVREAAEDMLSHVQLFAADIVEHDWHIRTKDAQGKAYVMKEDLGSFVDYVPLFPDAECDARLATALLATGETLGIDCGSGQGSPYDALAGEINYFNYAIVDHFHLSAIHLALTQGHPDVAKALLEGMILRLDRYLDPSTEEPGAEDENWGRDLSLLALKAASLGMPLTAREVRLIHQYHLGAAARYGLFPNFDLWDPSVPDGEYGWRDGFQPKRGPDAVRIEEVAFLLEYCWSPFRNPASHPLVDCDIVADPNRWGE